MRKNLSQWQLQSRSLCTGHEEDSALTEGTWEDEAIGDWQQILEEVAGLAVVCFQSLHSERGGVSAVT